MRSAKSDRKIVLGLVLALVAETMLLLWHMGALSWSVPAIRAGAGRAGQVAKAENRLRRRGFNALVWEKSAVDESLYFHDSILTLAQSTATLKLDQGSEIEMAENTLVTIEPPAKGSDGRIRLRFRRGGLSTRNPFVDTQIETGDFSVDLAAGADVQMREVAPEEFEIHLRNGRANLRSREGSRDLASGARVRVVKGQSMTLESDRLLRWSEVPPARIYTHDAAVDVRLGWEGEADELVWQRVGGPEQVAILAETDRHRVLALGLGRHRFYLRHEGRLGPEFEVEIWRAPLLHLLSPLPRDRVRTGGAVPFIWTAVREANSYILRWKGTRTETDHASLNNAHDLRFETEEDAEWSVWARDERGFEIPPPYSNSIFVRDAPLAAPKLRTPRVRAPAGDDRGAWNMFWNLLLPHALAEEVEVWEAVFAWEPVEGAEKYWLEISETPDFRNPVVAIQTRKTEFTWAGVQRRAYYWRVAGGSNQRMGLFSEAAELRLNDRGEPGLVDGVELRRRVIQISPVRPFAGGPKPQPEPAPAPALTEAAPPKVEPSPFRIAPSGLTILWRPGIGASQLGKGDATADFRGARMVSFSAEMDVARATDSFWRIYAVYTSTRYEPEPLSAFPFQEKVNLEHAKLRATRFVTDSPWGFGVSILRQVGLERADLEAVKLRPRLALAPHVAGIWGAEWQYQLEVGTAIGEGSFGAITDHRILWRSPWGFQLGTGFEAMLLGGSRGRSLSLDALLLLGHEF